MTHSLTNEICETIYCTWPEEHEASLVCDNMRTAADWQLEQVIQFLEANKDLSVETALRFIRPAMRPQQHPITYHHDVMINLKKSLISLLAFTLSFSLGTAFWCYLRSPGKWQECKKIYDNRPAQIMCFFK